jgi:hypothetical protein
VVTLASLVVISVAVLLRDPAGPLLESQNLPTSAEARPLRAEAVATATSAFARIELARERGDPALLAGVFVPGSPAEASHTAQARQARTVAARPAAAPPVTTARVTHLTLSWAAVRLEHTTADGTVPYRMVLRRVDDRYLVRDLVRLQE